MYNFNSQSKIPLRLSIAVSACLAPWFDDDILEKGLALIRENELAHFFFHRHVAGALLGGEYPLTIIYDKTSRIHQGFTLKTEDCSFCKSSRRKKRCEHIAALCLLSLIERTEDSPFPMPLLFQDSEWGKLAGFLHDWLSKERGNLDHTTDEKKICIRRTAPEGGVHAQFSVTTAIVWEVFDQESTAVQALRLYKAAQKISLSETERELVSLGSSSRALNRDISIWSRICALFYGLSAGKLPQISYEKESGLFLLDFGSEKTPDLLKIHLPRHRTLEIFEQLGCSEPLFSTLHPARQGAEVKMDEKGQITVKPLLWRDNRKTFLLSEISGRKFGNSYFFPGEGFLTLSKGDPKGKICRPHKQDVNPLFDFLEQDLDFTVADNELHDFIKENKIALAHPDNIVDKKISKLRIRTLPDTLIIHDFQEDQDWYYLSCDYGLGNSSISLDELLEKREVRDMLYMGTTSLQLKDSPLSWFHDLAPKREWTDSNGRRGVRLLPGEFISLISIIEDVQNRLEDNSFQSRLETLLKSESWSDLTIMSHVPDHLRTYQKNGLAWLHTLYELGLGGILADDMGLGKTHQGLALVEMVRRRKKEQTMLVICPASVLFHWRDKIDRFYPDISYSLYYGSSRTLSDAGQSRLILTTYGIVRSDREQFAKIPFEIILLDEIQNLKNSKTAIHQAVRSLQSRVKIGLSGTPIENSLTDLYSLFDICLPGIFGNIYQFKQTFVIPVTEKHDEKQKKNLSRLIQPFILRRSRTQVLTELPDLIEDNRICELSEDQLTLYRQAVDEQQLFLEELKAGSKGINFLNVLTLITRLKQICNHPCLVEKETDPGKYKSGKWDLFVELLNESLDSGLKVVVFSQYTGMLDIIEHYLKSAGVGYANLRGSMNIAKREQMIDKFTGEKDCMVFCSSLLAGGTGIDLLAAQVVIHYDRWWNPAKEEQATARVHRMGQKNVVQLFRLITVGTLEEKIHNIITRKQELASSVISEDEAGIIKQLDHRQLVELFR